MSKSNANLSKIVKNYLKNNPQIKKSLDVLNLTLPQYENAIKALTKRKISVSFKTTA